MIGQDMIGRVVGGYRLSEILGEGGDGDVAAVRMRRRDRLA